MRDAGVQGLLDRQCVSGAFPSTVEGPQGRVDDETCFVTAQVALILADLRAQAEGAAVSGRHAERLERALARALDFIETCAVPGLPGAFSFYPPEGTARLDIRLPADADDTALAWMALVAGGRRTRSQAACVLPTLLAAHRVVAPRRGDPPFARAPVVRTWLDPDAPVNPVDLIVNLNVLASLAAAGVDPDAHEGFAASLAARVAAAMPQAAPSLSQVRMLAPFYAHPRELAEALSRAVASGVEALAPALERIAQADVFGAPHDDQPLYCNAHGRPLWRSPALQAARRCRDGRAEILHTPFFPSSISGGSHDVHAQIRSR
jgi:hypothetical protein